MKNSRFFLSKSWILGVVGLWLGAPLSVFAQAEVKIPAAGQWTEGSTFSLKGNSGAWDDRMHGGIYVLSGIVPYNGKHQLFYIGASGDREYSDYGPANRALGLATRNLSNTSFNSYTKVSTSAAIVEHNPTPTGCNAMEEGVWRARSTLTADGSLLVYYAGLKQTSCTAVRADIFIATSSDGITFQKSTSPVLSGTGSQWGNSSGNEIFPAGAYEYDGQWHLFYITKNISPSYSLGVISGSAKNSFTISTSKKVLYPTETLGGSGERINEASIVALSDTKYALFLVVEKSAMHTIEVRTFHPTTPSQLSAPVATYPLNADANAIVYLDRDNSKWLLYYKKDSEATIRLKTAPMEFSGTTPLSQPATRTFDVTILLGRSGNPASFAYAPALRLDLGYIPATSSAIARHAVRPGLSIP